MKVGFEQIPQVGCGVQDFGRELKFELGRAANVLTSMGLQFELRTAVHLTPSNLFKTATLRCGTTLVETIDAHSNQFNYQSDSGQPLKLAQSFDECTGITTLSLPLSFKTNQLPMAGVPTYTLEVALADQPREVELIALVVQGMYQFLPIHPTMPVSFPVQTASVPLHTAEPVQVQDYGFFMYELNHAQHSEWAIIWSDQPLTTLTVVVDDHKSPTLNLDLLDPQLWRNFCKFHPTPDLEGYCYIIPFVNGSVVSGGTKYELWGTCPQTSETIQLRAYGYGPNHTVQKVTVTNPLAYDHCE